MNSWVETALKYLPHDVFNTIEGKVAFTIFRSDACRLLPEICEFEEIIVLSYWIEPSKAEDDPKSRYFIFCVLHEIAHVVQKHKPPYSISADLNKSQETEADSLALHWYNKYKLVLNGTLQKLTIEEINLIRDENQEKLQKILNHG